MSLRGRSGSAPKVLGSNRPGSPRLGGKRPGQTGGDKATRPKPAWDSTNHDLTVHRLTEAEIRKRKETLVSKHIDEARIEISRVGSEQSEAECGSHRDKSPSQSAEAYNPVRKTKQEIYGAISAPMTVYGEFDINTYQKQVQFDIQRAYEGTETDTNGEEYVVDFDQEIAGFEQYKSECSSEDHSKGSSKSQQSKQYKVAIPHKDFRKPQPTRPVSSGGVANIKKSVNHDRINLDDFEGKMTQLEMRMRSLETAPKQTAQLPETDQQSTLSTDRFNIIETTISELDRKLKQESAQRLTFSNSLVLCNRRIDDLTKELSVSRQETETLRQELARVVLHYEQQLAFIKQDTITTQQQITSYNLDLVIDKLNAVHDVSSFLETPQQGYSDEMIFYEAREKKDFISDAQAAQRNPNTAPKGRESDAQSQHTQHPRSASPGRIVFRNPQAGNMRAGHNPAQGFSKLS